ncbi:hypothetical protein EVAR_75504_1 [Eumeta japonica]|uniref:Uncharacterized protein n=1 Tax=Eumeta variegata TaxID=151549 RepID=A0A4C1TK75_EUMVA|nr:hypothetical protein EVAR_75504_1 [Eumeta japonica]
MRQRILTVFGLVETFLRRTLTMNDFQGLMIQPEGSVCESCEFENELKATPVCSLDKIYPTGVCTHRGLNTRTSSKLRINRVNNRFAGRAHAGRDRRRAALTNAVPAWNRVMTIVTNEAMNPLTIIILQVAKLADITNSHGPNGYKKFRQFHRNTTRSC